MKIVVTVILVLGALLGTAVDGQAAYHVDHRSGHAVTCSDVASNFADGNVGTLDLRHIDDYLPALFPPNVVPVAFLLHAATGVGTPTPATTKVFYRFDRHWLTTSLHYDMAYRIWVPYTWARTMSIYSQNGVRVFLQPCYRA